MKSSDIEKLKNIADGGGSRALADELIDVFDELGRSQQCSIRLLKHGALYERGSGNALFSVYFSRTSARGTVEVALADKNIARIYRRSDPDIAKWFEYLKSHVGVSAKSPTSQGYPRIAVGTVEAGHRLAQAIRAFLSGQPYKLAEAAGAKEHTQVKIDERILAAIMTRRGQPEFRAKLLAAYDSRCAITGCNAIEALEAAHIIPFSEDQNYALSNGILMRADIHTLFDLFLMSIEPRTFILRMAPGLVSAYGKLDGRRVTLPEGRDARPDPERLGKHFEQWVLRWAGGRT